MFQIDHMSRIPVYEQFIMQVETYLLKGILCAGDKLPSVRNLALEMSINPNTVQKALVEIERRGYISSILAKGSYIAEDALERLKMNKRKGLNEVKETVRELVLAGVTKSELLECIEEVYAESTAKNNVGTVSDEEVSAND